MTELNVTSDATEISLTAENIGYAIEKLKSGCAILCQIDGCTNIWTLHGWGYSDTEIYRSNPTYSLDNFKQYFEELFAEIPNSSFDVFAMLPYEAFYSILGELRNEQGTQIPS